MPLGEYFRILRRRGWIIVLLAILTAASALVFSTVQNPVYRATVNVLVQPARTDFGLAQSAKLLLDSYVAFLDTDNSAAAIIQDLQLDMLPEALRADVSIAAEAQRFLITIAVDNENGDAANDVARKWAELLVQWRNDENQKQRREDRVTALLLDAPRYVLDHPRRGLNTAAGGVLGILLGGLLIFFLEYWDAGILRTRADVERQLNLAVLGAIPTVSSSARASR
ncbi:hypothetical protein LBMAG37_04600 [Anaerolineae bacterium]|nr:hypothetical protein LBMAG37_04600 [Anaerolineae bacterium]